MHIISGPAVSYWKAGDKASGDYTVKATFTEPKYMNLNTTRILMACSSRGTTRGRRPTRISIARRTATVISSSADSGRRHFK